MAWRKVDGRLRLIVPNRTPYETTTPRHHETQHHGLVSPRLGAYLTRTRTFCEDGYAWYSHAGAQPCIPFWQSPPEVYVWRIAGFLTSPYDWGKPVIFGHYELEAPLLTPTKIGLDTAAWRTGRLTALHVETHTIISCTRAQ